MVVKGMAGDPAICSKTHLDTAPHDAPRKDKGGSIRSAMTDGGWNTQQALNLRLCHAGDNLTESVNGHCMSPEVQQEERCQPDWQQKPYSIDSGFKLHTRTTPPNEQHQEWEPAAVGPGIGTELNGWLPSAVCCSLAHVI